MLRAAGHAHEPRAASPRATPSTPPRACCASEGLTAFIVQAGGDLYVAGQQADGVALAGRRARSARRRRDDFFAMLEVEDHAFSTAGDYERGFV